MALLYYISVLFLYILAVPVLLYLSFKKKYRHSIPARFFLKNNPPFNSKNRIWFHVCSLGEVVSIKSIIEALEEEINLSVITQTGFKEAKSIKGATVRYLPFEVHLPFWVKKHDILVVSEAELWPMLFYVSKKRGAKNILINARISDNSYESYKRFAKFYRWVFSNIDVVFAQSETDKYRLEELGAKDVRVSGNIKTAQKIVPKSKYQKPSKRVILLASTHEGEEELILKNLPFGEDDKVIVVPRHPERFESVGKLVEKAAKKRDLKYSLISQDRELNSDLIVCDKMGELVSLYAISDIVILGGSFVEGIGGHNPIEPAYFNCKIISGEYFFNQKPLYKTVDNILTCKAEKIAKNLDNLKESKIKNRGDISPIIKEIKDGKSV